MLKQTSLVPIALAGLAVFSTASKAEQKPPATPTTAVTVAATEEFVKAPDPTKNQLLLKEFATKNFRVVKRIELPSRVYVKKCKLTGEYQHFLSNSEGKLSDPQRILLVGTVLTGDKLGESGQRFYTLTAEGRWRATEGPNEVVHQKADEKDGQESISFPPSTHKTPTQHASGFGSVTSPPTHESKPRK